MNTTTYGHNGTTTSSRPVSSFLGRISSRFGDYVARSRIERQLEQLDDRLLLDIGMKRSDIRRMVWGN
jgi:uncharacterized protein YjiS (DUF1127 family)